MKAVLYKEGAHLFKPEEGFGNGEVVGLRKDFEVGALGEGPTAVALSAERATDVIRES